MASSISSGVEKGGRGLFSTVPKSDNPIWSCQGWIGLSFHREMVAELKLLRFVARMCSHTRSCGDVLRVDDRHVV